MGDILCTGKSFSEILLCITTDIKQSGVKMTQQIATAASY